MLKHPVDSFKTDKRWNNELPAGNYFKVHAEQNQLQYVEVNNHSAFINILSKANDLRFILIDKKGKPIADAAVTLNGHRISYDAQAGLYHASTPKKGSLLIARYGGVSNFYKLGDEDDDDDDQDKSFFGKIWAAITRPFKKQKRRDYYVTVKKDYDGFIALNKPKYKPADTVKFKAFLLDNRSKKPISDKRMEIRLRESYGNDYQVIGYVNSYRDGGFESKFKLSDSLKLRLDRDYSIALAKPAKPGMDKKKARQHDLSSPTFRYEDYDLKSIQFAMRVNDEEQNPGEPLTVYLKATDENNLPVPDGRVTVTLTASSTTNNKLPYLFVRDTLWHHELNLDPVGETKLLIPDSIFPKADISYEINADFLNSANEGRNASKYLHYHNDRGERYRIVTKLVGDTLHASILEWGKEIKMPAEISGLTDDDDTLAFQRVILPARVKVNFAAKTYDIQADSAYDSFDFEDVKSEMAVSGRRTGDSLIIQVNNPHRAPFWYTVYADKSVIDAGNCDSLNYRLKYTGDANITFVTNYLWGGKSKSTQQVIPKQDKLLLFDVRQPASVYPGQRVTTEIEVKDTKGNPVPGVDLTAWAITRKFQKNALPGLNYLGKTHPKFEFQKEIKLSNPDNGFIKLNLDRWSKDMGLDSIAYYQFTHPDQIYRIAEPAPDTITQIAPFLVKKGNIEPVHILFIDERPVYFSQAEQMQRYSFRVSPGKHSLSFRTIDHRIQLDSVQVEQGKKLIISLNIDSTTNHSLRQKWMPKKLTDYEAGLLDKYMIRIVDNFDRKMAYVRQGKQLILLNPNPGNIGDILTGPLADNYADFFLHGNAPRQFLTEPGYSYLFEPGYNHLFAPGLLKQTSLKTPHAFNTSLAVGKASSDYTQYVFTHRGADSLWQKHLDERNRSESLFFNNDPSPDPAGMLHIAIIGYSKQELVNNIIIYSQNNPDFIRVLPGINYNTEKLSAGMYRLFFLLKGEQYMIKDSILIKPFGSNYYQVKLEPHVRDSLSIKISKVINDRPGYYTSSTRDKEIVNDALKLKEAFNDQYFKPGDYTDTMYGKVIDKKTNEALQGVAVTIMGISKGTVTDAAGEFKISVPKQGKLLFRYIGFNAAETSIRPNESVTISLVEQVQNLQEVVVVGYGTEIAGKLMGLSAAVSTVYAQTQVSQLRGLTFKSAAQEPLYIIDGVPVSSMTTIDPATVADISVLKDAAAEAIYGTRGSQGVVIITTQKKGLPLPASAAAGNDGLRKNFSDYAYWQPELITDDQGKASFTNTFPDDITSWRTYVVGITGKKQIGYTENQVRSFKPLSAAFISPQFAVKGDEMTAIGKVMNYGSTSVSVNRSFAYNGKAVKQDLLNVSNAHIDTLHATASGTDSLSFEYSIKRDNGYSDGELRKIPLIETGITETKGSFAALNRDTTVQFKFDPALGPVTFHAEASLLPILEQETEKLRQYKYLCNEQLASKLKGLLTQKRIKTYLHQPFKWDATVKDIIKKLSDSKKTSGLWGWWKDTDEELWISLHVVEALLDAQSEGYKADLNKEQLKDYLVYQVESYKSDERIFALQLLKKLDAKVDYQKYIETINTVSAGKNRLTRYDSYRLLLLQQQAGISVRVDTLLKSKHITMLGNIYWGDEGYNLLSNEVQVTLLAYRLFRNEGKHPEVLNGIRDYLLEQRGNDQWRNTYESAQILETLLPDLLITGDQNKLATLTFPGADRLDIVQFPYTTTLTGSDISVRKTGGLPVYVSAYQQYFNSKPKKVSKDFTVDTWFENNGAKVQSLKCGKSVKYQVTVIARGDADFVMIDVPVPAGCSYENKDQGWNGYEVHREYFKEKVSIFCRKLKQGEYTFTINLMPRFDGIYTINPAKAEMMYFPVFYGREGIKKVRIGALQY